MVVMEVGEEVVVGCCFHCKDPREWLAGQATTHLEHRQALAVAAEPGSGARVSPRLTNHEQLYFYTKNCGTHGFFPFF